MICWMRGSTGVGPLHRRWYRLAYIHQGRHAGVSGPPAKIYHVFNALSRDRMEQYVFSLTDDTFFRLVQQRTENSGLPQERVEEIAAFCRYAYVGFFLQFLWNRMEADIDRSVDRLGELMTAFVRSAMAEPSN